MGSTKAQCKACLTLELIMEEVSSSNPTRPRAMASLALNWCESEAIPIASEAEANPLGSLLHRLTQLAYRGWSPKTAETTFGKSKGLLPLT
jgi:hypothetical protein